MKVCLISDTHLRHKRSLIEVPESDILIHAGDACLGGDWYEVRDFFDWFKTLPGKRKVMIAGNHDRLWQDNIELAKSLIPPGIIYLQDSLVEIEGLKIWGSPWQPEFQDWAFNLPLGPALKAKWDLIPPGIDILVTHGPPMGILDWGFFSKMNVGCPDLRDAVDRVKPRLHVFGHIHGCYGMKRLGPTLFVNASVCDEAYKPTRDPVVVDLSKPGPAQLVSGGHEPVRRRESLRGDDPFLF